MNEEERIRLGKELVHGLKEDERRRKIDDMKKRAILTSKSYEEFKHFVACANQKTVSSKEMNEFRQSVKRYEVPLFIYSIRHVGMCVCVRKTSILICCDTCSFLQRKSSI